MITLLLETVIPFLDRFERNAKPASTWTDGRYRWVEMPCGCKNRTTYGNGDGVTSLCDAHGIWEESDDETYHDFIVIGEASWAVYSDDEIDQARAALRAAGIASALVYRYVDGETILTERVITAEKGES